ncbi:MAG: hypothetical protein AAGF11_22135 [Myxococcota bacterium]
MSLAKHLDRTLSRHLGMHVAWLPIATRYRLGDYGLRRGGIFEPVGNISEYGVEIEEVPGREVALDFTSTNATAVRIVGDATVDTFPQTSAKGELHLTFRNNRSLLLKSPRLSSTRIGNLAAIGRVIAKARRRDGLPWMGRYRVVSELFVGEDITVLSTRQRDTTVVLSGEAEALRGFEATAGATGISVESSEALGLNLVGKAGSIGLDLVRFTRRGISFAPGDTDEIQAEPASWDEDEAEDDL